MLKAFNVKDKLFYLFMFIFKDISMCFMRDGEAAIPTIEFRTDEC